MKKISRRNFVSSSALTAIGGATMFTENHKKREMKNVFVHHVFFWLKNADSKDDLNKLITGLKKLSAIKTIQQFHIGIPASTSRSVIDGSYQVSWFTLFANKADQDSYQTDPVHLQFVEACNALWNKVVVYDTVDM
jgi:hypothetical protein